MKLRSYYFWRELNWNLNTNILFDKNKCIFSREKTKAGQRYLDLDLSRSLVLIRWIADDILSLLNTYYIFICSYKYLKNYILTEYKIEHIASLVI